MKKSYLNSIKAILYIVFIVLLLSSRFPEKTENELISGMIVLSLFVLSAATMGYLFISEPIMLYIDGKKKEAVSFFLETLFSFAIITFILILIAFFISLI